MSTQIENCGPIAVEEIQALKFPDAFFDALVQHLPIVLRHQREDGRIWYDFVQGLGSPQNAVFPMAFMLTTGDSEWRNSSVLRDALRKYAQFLEKNINDHGEFMFDPKGIQITQLDQRFLYAWTEALRLLRDAKEDFPYDVWEKKITAGCEKLIDHRLKNLVGLRKLIGRVLGTSMNHVALYLTAVYRAGMVFNKKEFCDFTMPIIRVLAGNIHPDGYWEEHNDLSHEVGPTMCYGYLTHGAMSLLYEWTREPLILESLKKSTDFYSKFLYPDATYLDLIDERVRYHHWPRSRLWGLFGFSHTKVGRGTAAAHHAGWLRQPFGQTFSEELARQCENYMYWHQGEIEMPPFISESHKAHLSLPFAIHRKGSWSLGVSGMRATVPEDLAYQENAFALERQKLFSVWHSQCGLLIDGSHAKGQPENSTFATFVNKHWDYWPVEGSIVDGDGCYRVWAKYKTFTAALALKAVNDQELKIEFEADFTSLYAPVFAGFTLYRLAEEVVGANGKRWLLSDEKFEVTSSDFGGQFSYGAATFTGPAEMKVSWPFKPYESYRADHQAPEDAYIVRVVVPLTPQKPQSSVTVMVR